MNAPDRVGPMRVEKLSASIPLATVTCGHGREMGYNLHAGIAAHFDDASACRLTGLAHGVDEELASRDELSDASLRLVRDASTRLDALLSGATGGGRPW